MKSKQHRHFVFIHVESFSITDFSLLVYAFFHFICLFTSFLRHRRSKCAFNLSNLNLAITLSGQNSTVLSDE